MIPKEIRCIYCGWEGNTGGNHPETDDPAERIFKYLGRNPISGHLHYQCPACAVVLLLPSIGILRGVFRRPIPHASSPKNEVPVGGKHGQAVCH